MGWILSALVLLLLFAVGAILMNPVRLLTTGNRAKGVVVELDSISSQPGIPGAGFLFSPIVEFPTSTGERIRVKSRSSYPSASLVVGDEVKIVYSKSNPRNAQILTLKEFPLIPVGTVLGFAVFILLIWISVILISGDLKMGDPLHLLTSLISHFRINPVRFPFFLIMSFTIPACFIGTYVVSKQAIDLHSNGIKVVGTVIGEVFDSSQTSDGVGNAGGWFSTISFKDLSGEVHKIGRLLPKPLSRLKSGDKVEIIYPTRHPELGVVNIWDELYFQPLIWGLFLFTFLTLLLLVLKGTIPLR